MSAPVFRRELLYNNGPGRLVVQYDSQRCVQSEVFWIERQGATKQLPRLSVQEVDWLLRTLLDLRDHLMAASVLANPQEPTP